ncbi:lytic transglycosylase F [Phreatobacter stygius]|nr:lytic transglycosylase F [Phreatobacter stygius]
MAKTKRCAGSAARLLALAAMSLSSLGLSSLALSTPGLAQPAPAAGQAPAARPAGAPPRTMALPRIRPWTGDLDGMLKRRTVRILVPYSKTLFFVDRGRQMGLNAEFGQALEDWLNKRHPQRNLRIYVAFVPTARDQLLPALVAGLGDIVAANLTVTPEREAAIDFARPWMRDVREVVVTGPGAPALTRIEDLAGQTVHVRASSSYATHLASLSRRLVSEGARPIVIAPADENLEDEDLMEMVHAGLLPFAVVDEHKAKVWAEVLSGLTLRPDLVVHAGGEIAWAMRENSPLLRAELDAFFAQHQAGTSFGNTLRRRYFTDTRMARNALAEDDARRHGELLGLFQRYGGQYGFDALMISAQGYQESQLDQSRRSPRGAVGIMQLLPATARSPEVGISDIGTSAENNIHAGARYLRHLVDTYINDPGLSERNRTLFAFAAYNAGPGNLRRFRARAKAEGLNPDVWFNNVEQAAALIVGRETPQYVSNIYKYYTAYRMLAERERDQARGTTAPDPAAASLPTGSDAAAPNPIAPDPATRPRTP